MCKSSILKYYVQTISCEYNTMSLGKSQILILGHTVLKLMQDSQNLFRRTEYWVLSVSYILNLKFDRVLTGWPTWPTTLFMFASFSRARYSTQDQYFFVNHTFLISLLRKLFKQSTFPKPRMDFSKKQIEFQKMDHPGGIWALELRVSGGQAPWKTWTSQRGQMPGPSSHCVPAPSLHSVSTPCNNEEKSSQNRHRPIGWELRQSRRSRTQVWKEVFRSNSWNGRGLLFCYFLLSPYLETLGPLANFSSRQNSSDKGGLNVFVLEEYFLILSSVIFVPLYSFLNFSFIYTKELIRIKDFCPWILMWMQTCHSTLIHFNINNPREHSPPLTWQSPCLSCNVPLIAPGQKWTANRLSKL